MAPLAEVKLGLGGTSYSEFIESVNLPSQLAMVDPIVASFTARPGIGFRAQGSELRAQGLVFRI